MTWATMAATGVAPLTAMVAASYSWLGTDTALDSSAEMMTQDAAMGVEPRVAPAPSTDRGTADMGERLYDGAQHGDGMGFGYESGEGYGAGPAQFSGDGSFRADGDAQGCGSGDGRDGYHRRTFDDEGGCGVTDSLTSGCGCGNEDGEGQG